MLRSIPRSVARPAISLFFSEPHSTPVRCARFGPLLKPQEMPKLVQRAAASDAMPMPEGKKVDDVTGPMMAPLVANENWVRRRVSFDCYPPHPLTMLSPPSSEGL